MDNHEGVTEETTHITVNLDQATILWLLLEQGKKHYTNRHRDLLEQIHGEVKEAIIYLQKEEDAPIKGIQER